MVKEAIICSTLTRSAGAGAWSKSGSTWVALSAGTARVTPISMASRGLGDQVT